MILSLPLVAMLVTDEVVWSLADFVRAGVRLTTIGVALELAVKKDLANRNRHRRPRRRGGHLRERRRRAGLVLPGIVLIASACALGVRARHANGP
jgi:hypothetical protein